MAARALREIGRGARPDMRGLLMTPGNVTRVADQLARMRGAAMKVGQLISMDAGEVLPPELADIMARLRDQAHFMPPKQLRDVLNRAWGADWRKSFQSFDVRPIAAASIGQVHRATLKDGRDVAIKVQYPGIARSIDSDVANVAALVRMSGLLPQSFDLDPYIQEARSQLHEETDYEREGHHLRHFADLLQSDEAFEIPEFFPDWSTPEVLTMSFLEGRPIEAVSDATSEERNRVSEALVNLTLCEIFEFGMMQSDPNFANYRYLHNHARMWFASIWIFTLHIPWQLGADFFLRHLLDGDPASNTLSWRWVGGLHTKGKTYLARPDNIAKYTEGRFQPKNLAKFAEPLTETVEHPLIPLLTPQEPPEGPYLMLLTEDDLSADSLMPTSPAAAIGLLATHGRSPNPIAGAVTDFAEGAMNSALEPHGKRAQSAEDWSDPLIEAARNTGVKTIATAYAPVGPTRSRLDRAEPLLRDAGLSLNRIIRPHDTITWPHARAGFFGLRKKIPSLLSQLNLATQPRP
ncbi:AarF/UbiB family protein [Ruegeria sp. YS9]|uniref:AarF/UbiB family protein n=1 Tax=Ruegeria sp. YS9 TaxID=2966453 RepID=UPI00214C8529|nr:AarF/UbiB family protein [Ruegeria sp. YS9]UUV06184.1 AarF/UbiB family protein [Ruegeria sp. YS9]